MTDSSARIIRSPASRQTAGQPLVSPDWRTGGFRPRVRASVMEISTWVWLRTGPSTATLWNTPLAVTMLIRSSARN